MTAHSDLSIVAIIPLYNGVRWIEQTITSVLSQSLPPDEFIVVDDGSTDGGAGAAVVEQMARKYPIITLMGKPNGGQSSARNFGVARSRSALIALLDQDDYWYPDHLEALRRPFEEDRYGRIGWVYSDLDRIDKDGYLFCRRFLSTLPNVHPKEHIYDCLRRDMFILPSASLIARRAFESIDGFDERLVGYEDDDLFLRMFRAGWANRFIEKPLSAWRIFPSSTSYTARMAKSRMIYLDKLIKAFPNEKRTHSYYVEDYIAPRFVKTLFADILVASREPDWNRVRRSATDLYIAAAFLRPIKRMLIRAFAVISRVPFLVWPALMAGLIARRMFAFRPESSG